MAEPYCKSYVNKIFAKYSQNGSHVLERSQVNVWLEKDLNDSPLKKE